MSWDWLLQIFRSEGEVVDVFVSHKRCKISGSRFGFVHFKEMEEAKRAVRNLNGIKVRGNMLKVSFSKYDRNGVLRSGQVHHGEIKYVEFLGKVKGSKDGFRYARSFKEVVEGVPQHPKGDDKEVARCWNPIVLDSNLVQESIDKKYIKEMGMKLVEEIFSPSILEVVKQKLERVFDEVLDVQECFTCMQGRT